MNYKLEYLSENDFEKLVNMVCHEILGCGVIEFSKGNYELDNYLLFTNRKLSGVKGTSLVQKIKKDVGIDHVEIIGKEVINRSLSTFKHSNILQNNLILCLPKGHIFF